MKEDKTKPIRLWLLFFNIAIVASYGLILFFTNWEILRYFGFKLAIFYAVANIILYFILNNFVEKNEQDIFELSVFLNVLYVFFMVDYFGGINSIIFPLIYLFLIAAFIIKKKWGFIYLGITVAYFALATILNPELFSESIWQLLSPVVTILVVGAGGYYLNREHESVKKNNENLNKIASKLTAEKSQDEAVLTAIADGVYAVDMDRNLVLLNKSAQGMIGWDEKDALGMKCKTVMKFINDGDVSVCEKDCPAMQVWNTGQPIFRTDICFAHRKTKKRIQLSSSYAPIKDMNGNMAGAICVFRDITKEKYSQLHKKLQA